MENTSQIISTNLTNLNNAVSAANNYIIPSKDCPTCVPGWAIDITIFILGSILFAIMLLYLLKIILGRPMTVAADAISGGSMIQHFNTSKSSEFKLANVAGGAFRYKNIRDGTVAASPKGVYSVNGRNLVLTYAQLGMTIPVNILAAVSLLVYSGTNNIKELYKKYTIVKKVIDEDGNEIITKELSKEKILIGYNFDDFRELNKQVKQEKLIPLIIEAFPEFIEKNINADFTEKHIKLEEQKYKLSDNDSEFMKIMPFVLACVIILGVGFVLIK